MSARLLVAAFLLGHAAIHTGFLAPRPPPTATGPTWPFVLDRSMILGSLGVDSARSQLIGMALVAITICGFALAAVAMLGMALAGLWSMAVAIGCVGSLGLLLLFFNRLLVLGVTIDLALLWAVFAMGWTPTDTTA
jgi:hypothetical protein